MGCDADSSALYCGVSASGDYGRRALQSREIQPIAEALDIVPAPRGCKGESKYFFWNGVGSERTMKHIAGRSLGSIFAKSQVPKAHAHRFRHTLATELIGAGASFEVVADILGNSPDVVRKHYAKWSPARQVNIDSLMETVHSTATYITPSAPGRLQ
jgi:integrase